MGESAPPLTDEDWQAAKKTLERYPELADENKLPDAERELAQLHQRWGSSKFQLQFGFREPVTIADQCELDLFRGNITLDECRERLRGYAHRAVDAEMLRKFFAELGEQVHRYGRFMQEAGDLVLNPRRQPVTEADEIEVDELAAAIRQKSNLYKQEITTVFEYLQQARVEKRMGNVQLGEFYTPTAAELVVLVTHNAQKSWKNNREIGLKGQTQPEYRNAIRGVELFAEHGYRSLPRAQHLQTLLDEEYALARICLQEREPAPAPPLAPAAEAAEPAEAPCLFRVSHWSDLAIGIDEKNRMWAMTPAPALGSPFVKSKAFELTIPGKRWSSVLKVFASARDPHRASDQEVLRALNHLPPPAADDAWQAALAEQLSAIETNTTLKMDLADLGRNLRKVVDGPTGKGRSAFSLDGDQVTCRFVVRYLLPDESGQLRFGERPRP